MVKHIIVTYAATLAAIALLIALPASVTSKPVAAPDARAAECAAALAYATPDLRAAYLPLCVDGYAIEGVDGYAYDAR